MIELVWDSGRLGTATAPSGASATVGDRADYDPDDLLGMAAASSVMRTFLELAEPRDLPILSYAATAYVESPANGRKPCVHVCSFVVASDTVKQSDVLRVLEIAVATSSICRMLGDRIAHSSEIRCLSGACVN
jgi:hypothetical protein